MAQRPARVIRTRSRGRASSSVDELDERDEPIQPPKGASSNESDSDLAESMGRMRTDSISENVMRKVKAKTPERKLLSPGRHKTSKYVVDDDVVVEPHPRSRKSVSSNPKISPAEKKTKCSKSGSIGYAASSGPPSLGCEQQLSVSIAAVSTPSQPSLMLPSLQAPQHALLAGQSFACTNPVTFSDIIVILESKTNDQVFEKEYVATYYQLMGRIVELFISNPSQWYSVAHSMLTGSPKLARGMYNIICANIGSLLCGNAIIILKDGEIHQCTEAGPYTATEDQVIFRGPSSHTVGLLLCCVNSVFLFLAQKRSMAAVLVSSVVPLLLVDADMFHSVLTGIARYNQLPTLYIHLAGAIEFDHMCTLLSRCPEFVATLLSYSASVDPEIRAPFLKLVLQVLKSAHPNFDKAKRSCVNTSTKLLMQKQWLGTLVGGFLSSKDEPCINELLHNLFEPASLNGIAKRIYDPLCQAVLFDIWEQLNVTAYTWPTNTFLPMDYFTAQLDSPKVLDFCASDDTAAKDCMADTLRLRCVEGRALKFANYYDAKDRTYGALSDSVTELFVRLEAEKAGPPH